MNLDNILVTPLKRIPIDGGDVLHAIKKSDSGFNGFGEIYFTWIKHGSVKAWKCHQRMTLNLVVPIGEVHFGFQLRNEKNSFRTEIISEDRYVRLTVPPGIWFGFKGIASGSSLVMNVSDIEHDPNEVEHKPLSSFSYNWSDE